MQTERKQGGATTNTAAITVLCLLLWILHLPAIATEAAGLDQAAIPVTSPVALSNTPAVGITGAKFTGFGVPAINQAGHVAFRALVTGSIAVVHTGNRVTYIRFNSIGIWADDQAGKRQLIIRTGTTIAPDTGGSVFSGLGDPVYNNNNAVAFLGTLLRGVGDAEVRPIDNTIGIWSNDGGTLHLVVRTGMAAPGIPTGATFAKFDSFALPDQGGVVMLATLARDASADITRGNNQGIWAVDTTGDLQLIVRTGSPHPVTGKIVSSLSFLPAEDASAQTRGFSPSTGDLLYTAIFSDGTSGVFQVIY